MLMLTHGVTCLPHRNDLLRALPKGGIVAEYGVHRGDFAQQIWDITKPSKLYLIDPWQPDQELLNGIDVATGAECYQNVCSRFSEQIAAGTVVLIRDTSHNCSSKLKDIIFDWVYLDTFHLYPTTLLELRILDGLVSPTGLICGHDYDCMTSNGFFSVNKAVHEFLGETDWEMAYLTCEDFTEVSD